ncbi:hypothetical protein QWE_00025 [Agrobacterium albertimagni AOL15]|uniref:Uncharacterized protein n=1 Tax=Agrobacterium albertimagni AOL15 TaxID=1156935 RepID=K2PKP6_9HYPH|nr:hypothetical protein [Agrobacterium albertimagni]EKF61543.1 hypothetical protein QWE_00025 [Agrobacterium albertimagni AOL15]
MKRRLMVLSTGLAAFAALAALTYWGTRECGFFDTALGLSGCTGSRTIAGVSTLASTLARDTDGYLVVLGNKYEDVPGSRNYRVTTQVVRIDWAQGREVERVSFPAFGRIDQMQISPDGETIAVTCNTIYVCDLLSSADQRDALYSTQLALLNRDGSIVWHASVPMEDARPNSEGRSFDLAFAEDGQAVVAGAVAFAISDGAPLRGALPPAVSSNATINATDQIELAGAPRMLDLPDHYIPFNQLQSALSPDGARLATLSRRFSGKGMPRAILQVWDVETGGVLARHEIDTDLSPALAWQSDGQAVFVATAVGVEPGAATDLRRYGVEAGR